MKTLEVISPIGAETSDKAKLAPRLDTLDGKTICEAWNEGFKGDHMFPLYRKFLKERYTGVKVIPFSEFPYSTIAGTPAQQREVSLKIATLAKERGCDALITGNGG